MTQTVRKTYRLKILPRRGTTAQWAASDRILEDGEFGYDITLNITKRGDGVHLWADLPEFAAGIDPSEIDALADELAALTESYEGLSSAISTVSAAANRARILSRPPWLPDDVGAAPLNPAATTVANVAIPSGTAFANLCTWYGEDGTAPTAGRFIVGVFAVVTYFRLAVYDSDGVLRYLSVDGSADVGSNGTKTLAFLPVGTPRTFLFGEPVSLGWLAIGTGLQVPRFAPLSAAVGNLGFTVPRRPAVSITSQTEMPISLSGHSTTGTVWLGQILK